MLHGVDRGLMRQVHMRTVGAGLRCCKTRRTALLAANLCLRAACAACAQIRKLLQRDPALRPTPRQLLAERIFQARGNTTTHVSQGSSLSHGSSGTCGAASPLSS